MIETNDWLEKYKKKNIELGLKEGCFCQEMHILCPHCGYAQKDAYQDLPNNQEDWANYECEKCDKKFRMCYEYFYSTIKLMM